MVDVDGGEWVGFGVGGAMVEVVQWAWVVVVVVVVIVGCGCVLAEVTVFVSCGRHILGSGCVVRGWGVVQGPCGGGRYLGVVMRVMLAAGGLWWGLVRE